jgi:hypothetical protein
VRGSGFGGESLRAQALTPKIRAVTTVIPREP